MDGTDRESATTGSFDAATLGPLFERLPTGIAVFDHEGHLTLANPVLEHMVGQNRLDLAGHELHTLVHPDDASACRRAFAFFPRDGTDRQIKARLARADTEAELWCAIQLGWLHSLPNTRTRLTYCSPTSSCLA